MADKSKIEWTDATWNPIRAKALNADGSERKGWHCEHASEGCRYCYAETFNKRLGTGFDYKPGHLRKDVAVYLDEKMLMLPLKWRKPRQIFVCSMTDLFADFVSDEILDRIFAVMAQCPQHTFQVLTKRSARMRAYLATWQPWVDPRGRVLSAERCAWMREVALGPRQPSYVTKGGVAPNDRPKNSTLIHYHELGWPLSNVWLGVSVENQEAADKRIPDLLATPAAVRWLSCEPLLGQVKLLEVCGGHFFQNPLTGLRYHDAPEGVFSASDHEGKKIDWVVAGGESGANARPMHPDWARSLRDQCASAGVPFFFKQWGEWAPADTIAAGGAAGLRAVGFPDSSMPSYRIGKNKAGRLLDGKTYDAMPIGGAA